MKTNQSDLIRLSNFFFIFFIFFPPPSSPPLSPFCPVRDGEKGEGGGGKKKRGKNGKEKEKWNIARNVLEIELRDAERERIQATDRLNFSLR